MSPAVLRTLRIQLSGQRHLALENGRDRLVLLLLLFTLAVGLIVLRLVDLTIIQRTPRVDAAPGYARVVRADILDRNGATLSTSLEVNSLAANPRLINDPAGLAAKIVAIIPTLDQAEVARQLSARKGRFRWIKRKLSPRQVKALIALGEPGLLFEREYERIYPNGRTAAHVLGYTNVDGEGIAGIESFFDSRLADPKTSTTPLQLSIDLRVQHALEDEIAKSMAKHQALAGFGLVMDVHTGEIVALVSLPDYDANDPNHAHASARFNMVTKGVYELGSTFKAFALAQALEEGTTSLGERYDATKALQIGRFSIRDFKPKNRWLTATEVFIYSSNIGTARMIDEVGPERQQAFLEKFGFTKAASIELPEVGKPLLPANWGRLASFTVAYGHGLAATPLQLASGLAALVNGGTRVQPTLRAGAQPQAGARLLSQATSDTMRAVLRLAVDDGTGGHANVPGYRVGGKTGTSEKAVAGGYNSKARMALFAGAFPMDAPRYVVIAGIDEPKGTADTGGYATGGAVAAPVVGRFIARAAPLLGVTPDLTRDINLTPYLAYVAAPKKPLSPEWQAKLALPAPNVAQLPAAPKTPATTVSAPKPAPSAVLADIGARL